MNRAVWCSCLVVLLTVADRGAAQVKPKGAKETGAGRPRAAQAGDFLSEVQKANAARPAPQNDFRPGNVSPRTLEADAITKMAEGFSIKMPSGTPVPTPAVSGSRLYSGGGFSCKEFYCFDARSGKLIWGVDLDDDGPSSPIVEDGTVIFNTESCTIFALDGESGKLLWSHWLGDPLMSMPAAGGGRVFTAYPIADDEKPAKGDFNYALAAFDLKSGKVLWQRRIDSDCITAPVISGEDVYVATLSGGLYRFAASDGRIKGAQQIRATSAPVVVDNELFVTRRDDPGKKDSEVFEAIAAQDLRTQQERYVANRRAAPYLDARVQRASAASAEANGFESKNGIMGGFGGGFGALNYRSPGELAKRSLTRAGSGKFRLINFPGGQDDANDAAADNEPHDALAAEQQKAAKIIGKGNVHTIQGFQGSRVLHWGDRNYNCMGDAIFCTSSAAGKVLWSLPLKGDLKKEGGHLAAPPVPAGDQLFAATLSGDVLQINPKTGAVARKFSVGAPLRFAPVIEGGWIYVGTQDGKLIGINTKRPELSGWPTWGGDPAHTSVYGANH